MLKKVKVLQGHIFSDTHVMLLVQNDMRDHSKVNTMQFLLCMNIQTSMLKTNCQHQDCTDIYLKINCCQNCKFILILYMQFSHIEIFLKLMFLQYQEKTSIIIRRFLGVALVITNYL